MARFQPSLLLSVLRDPACADGLSLLDWDLLIRQGRRANLLARLALLLERCALQVPSAPALHLGAAKCIAERQQKAVQWEVTCIGRALAEVPLPVTLLKGAAYVLAGLPAADGRLFSDIDVLVPKASIERVESALTLHGWRGADLDEYDQRFYRRWMHEIPPMSHVRRASSIDVHHTILPETARTRINTPALFEGVVEVIGRPGVQVLQPVDMLLHSAAHLFHEGELENGLRDLFDLDSLFRDFGRDSGFWSELVPRARVLGLGRVLFYAVRYTTMMLGTPVPEAVIEQARGSQPPGIVLAMMDACYFRALQPMHASCDALGTPAARWLLYVRSHWLRLPLHFLAYHLLRKAIKPAQPQPDAPPMGAQAEETTSAKA